MAVAVDKISSNETKHEGDVTSVTYHNGYVYSTGADGKIKIWEKDLKLKKTLNCHEGYIYALAITPQGKLYSSSCDGTIKYISNPFSTDDVRELLHSQFEIQCLKFIDNRLYSGDDKGVITMWQDDRIIFKFNLCEEIKSLSAESNMIYTARNLDTVITEVILGKSGKCVTKATIPGSSPLDLIGPLVEKRRSYLVFATRGGKGITLVNNLAGENFSIKWTKEDCHTMIINAFCGVNNTLFSGGWDGKVKKWNDIDKNPKLAGEVDIGCCINSICNGEIGNIYVGACDGVIRRIHFK